MHLHTLRLTPGADLRDALARFAKSRRLRAAATVSGIGSLTTAAIRFAGNEAVTVVPGPLEITSLAGTLSRDGLHVHICVADGDGRCLGGHLAAGSIVRTTAEVVIAELHGQVFRRAIDPSTGYRELVVRRTRHRG